MNVSCSNCPAKYAVPDEKVRGRKVRITCKRCGAAIIVDGTAADGGEAATGKLSAATTASVRPADPASVAKAATGPRPAVAVPSVGGTSASVTGRTMKRTMVGIPGPAADAAPAPAPGAFPSPAPVALREEPKREEPKRPAEQASGKSFAKQTMVGGIAVTPRRQPEPPPPAPAEEWTVAVTDETHEPMTLTQIISAYAAGRIDAETFIWKEGMPDWQMPFEIPVIEAALRSKGFRPSRLAPPPAATPEPAQARALSGYDDNAHEKPTAVTESPFDGGFPDAGGMWREPGRWNEAGSPFADRQAASPYKEQQEERELPSFGESGEGGISFDDVTVAMRAPEAEKLLKEAADESGPRMVGEADSEQKIPTTGWDLSEFGAAPGDETIKYDKTKHPAINEFRGVDEDAAGAIPAEFAPPPLAAPKPRPMARAAVRRPPEEAKADLFSGSASTETVEEPIDGGANKDALKMTGARNESSVLFSLDAMMKSEGKPPGKKVEPPKKEHDVLLGGGIPATDARFGTALAAPDFSAPVTESVAPKPVVESRAAASSVEAETPSAGGGWLWAAIVVVALVVIGVTLWFVRPAWLVSALPGLFPAPPSTASAEPATTAAATATATAATPAPPAPESAAIASGAPPASAPPAAPAAAGKPAPPTQPAAKPAPAAAAAKPAAPAAAPPAEKTPAAEPGPASDLPPFDKGAAAAALNSAAANVASCKQEGGPVGTGRAAVTFAPSGRATNAIISGDFAGTAVGGCVARLFRQTRVGPFSGEPVTVAKSFTIQ